MLKVLTLQGAERWLSRPQGAPSGVCTGPKKPQASGNSLRTDVVRICAKKAPRCTHRKWERYLIKFNLSATTANPEVWNERNQ